MGRLFEERVWLERQKQKLKTAVAANQDMIRRLDERIVEQMAELGATSVKLDGDITLYQQRNTAFNVRVADWEQVVGILRNLNEGQIVQERVNPATLKSWCKEWLAAGGTLPEGINVVDLPTSIRLRGVKESDSNGE